MSYDIRFRVQVKDTDEYVDVGNCDANITWNVRKIIVKSTGLEWKNEENNGFVKDVIPYIKRGLSELEYFPEKYKKYESPNGWGTIEGTKNFFKNIIISWDTLNYFSPKIADVATFWIT